MLLKKSSRAQINLDLILIIVVLFGLGAVAIVGSMLATSISDELTEDGDFNNESLAVVQGISEQYPSWFDNAFLFILVFFWVGMLISSFMIDSHPAFFIIAVILIIISLLIGAAITNSMEELFNDDDFSSVAAKYPRMVWIIDHWLIIAIVMAFSSAIAMYAKGAT